MYLRNRLLIERLMTKATADVDMELLRDAAAAIERLEHMVDRLLDSYKNHPLSIHSLNTESK